MCRLLGGESMIVAGVRCAIAQILDGIPHLEEAPARRSWCPRIRFMNDNALPRRTVRSYVLRAGRTTPGQTRALATFGATYLVPFERRLLDHERLFGRSAPTVLEIGFGMGEATARIAAALPDRNFIGVRSPRSRRRRAAASASASRACRTCARAPRRGRGARAHDRAALACRRARLLSRSVAQEAPSQAPPRASAFRAPACRAHRARRLSCIAQPTGNRMRSRCWRCCRPSRGSRTPPSATRRNPTTAR